MGIKYNNPVYIIIGATGGIGSELCNDLNKDSCHIVACSNNLEKLNTLSKEQATDSCALDATDFKQVDSCVSNVLEKYGRLDGVVNCVGSILLKPSHLTTEEDWNKTISLNLTSAFSTLRSSARTMMEAKGGSIVLVSSAAAITGLANHEAISAAKAGIVGLVMSAAATYSRYGIRVNCVAPGLVRTPLTEHLTSNEAVLKKSEKM
ncbi:MAG: SDR family NAD(P)-dependent oxidoreductase, partial [Nitrosopumilaceae archaeon]|nr:SDR family NAD(P)-dependent oxidoreductase [Nitrosopumilaceae archaeon]